MGYISVVPPYTLIVSADRHPVNPRSYDCFGKLICFKPIRLIGDPHTYENNNEFLRDIIQDGAGSDEDHSNTNQLLRGAERTNLLMPVYMNMKDDSGISISAMPIWTYDSLYALENRQIGWIYASYDSIKNEFSADAITPELIENAKVLLYGEVDYYNSYLRGECYRFDLYRGGKPVANYIGLLGKLEDVKKEIEDLIPDDCRGITDKLRCIEPGSGLSFVPESETLTLTYPEIPQPTAYPSGSEAISGRASRGINEVPVDVDVFPVNDPAGITLAIANIVIDNNIAVNGITIERRSNDLAVTMPKAKDINGRSFNVCAIISKELRALVNTLIMETYASKMAERAAVKF